MNVRSVFWISFFFTVIFLVTNVHTRWRNKQSLAHLERFHRHSLRNQWPRRRLSSHELLLRHRRPWRHHYPNRRFDDIRQRRQLEIRMNRIPHPHRGRLGRHIGHHGLRRKSFHHFADDFYEEDDSLDGNYIDLDHYYHVENDHGIEGAVGLKQYLQDHESYEHDEFFQEHDGDHHHLIDFGAFDNEFKKNRKKRKKVKQIYDHDEDVHLGFDDYKSHITHNHGDDDFHLGFDEYNTNENYNHHDEDVHLGIQDYKTNVNHDHYNEKPLLNSFKDFHSNIQKKPRPYKGIPHGSQGCTDSYGSFHYPHETWQLPGCARATCSRSLKGSWEVWKEKCDANVQNPEYACVITRQKRLPFPDCCPRPSQCRNDV